MRFLFSLTIPQFIILSLFSLTFLHSRHILENSETSSFLLKRTSSLQNLPFNYSDFGFYLNLKYDTKDKTDLTCVLPAFYSSKTILASKCEKFFQFKCEEPACKDLPDQPTESEYPFFKGVGHEISTPLYLSKNEWELQVNALYATECTGAEGDLFGDGMYGMIGFGLSGDSYKNYVNQKVPLFSIYINEEITEGVLNFAKDSSRAMTNDPVISMPACNDWQVHDIYEMEVGEKKLKVDTHILFDINAQSIGFPQVMYKDIIDGLVAGIKGAELKCPTEASNSYNYLPVCDFTGNVTFVPSVSIVIGTQKLVLPPNLLVGYIKNSTEGHGTIQFNIRAVNSKFVDMKNYVTPGFDDYIILDAYTLSYYYAVFEGTDFAHNSNKIHLYVANHHPNDGGNHTALWLILAFIAAGLIIALGYSFTKPKNVPVGNSGENQEPLIGPSDDHPSSN